MMYAQPFVVCGCVTLTPLGGLGSGNFLLSLRPFLGIGGQKGLCAAAALWRPVGAPAAAVTGTAASVACWRGAAAQARNRPCGACPGAWLTPLGWPASTTCQPAAVRLTVPGDCAVTGGTAPAKASVMPPVAGTRAAGAA